MGKSSSTPDPYTTANAQTQSNEQTAAYNAALNRTSEYTPYGNSVYSQTGTDSTGAPIWSNTINLTPEAQKQLDNQLTQNDQISNIGFGLADQAQNSLANPITSASAGPLQYSAGGDFSAAQQQAQDAAYKSATGYLDPQWENNQNDMNAQLANQGVVQGSDAYNRAQTQYSNEKTQAYNQAQDSAIQTGNAEQNTLQQQAAANASLNNSAVGQSLAQQENLATLPLNELNALRAGTQIQNPTFTTAPSSTAQPNNISGDIYQSAQMQNAANNNFMSGLFGIGSSLASTAKWSDRRLKRDIRRVGRTRVLRLPLYEFSYVWAPGVRHIGVMADEAARVIPAAVRRDASGYRMVDYRLVA